MRSGHPWNGPASDRRSGRRPSPTCCRTGCGSGRSSSGRYAGTAARQGGRRDWACRNGCAAGRCAPAPARRRVLPRRRAWHRRAPEMQPERPHRRSARRDLPAHPHRRRRASAHTPDCHRRQAAARASDGRRPPARRPGRCCSARGRCGVDSCARPPSLQPTRTRPAPVGVSESSRRRARARTRSRRWSASGRAKRSFFSIRAR